MSQLPGPGARGEPHVNHFTAVCPGIADRPARQPPPSRITDAGHPRMVPEHFWRICSSWNRWISCNGSGPGCGGCTDREALAWRLCLCCSSDLRCASRSFLSSVLARFSSIWSFHVRIVSLISWSRRLRRPGSLVSLCLALLPAHLLVILLLFLHLRSRQGRRHIRFRCACCPGAVDRNTAVVPARVESGLLLGIPRAPRYESKQGHATQDQARRKDVAHLTGHVTSPAGRGGATATPLIGPTVGQAVSGPCRNHLCHRRTTKTKKGNIALKQILPMRPPVRQ